MVRAAPVIRAAELVWPMPVISARVVPGSGMVHFSMMDSQVKR